MEKPCATTQIMQAFCKQELLADVSDLAQFLIDLDDPECPIKFVDDSKVEKLEEELEELQLNEPVEYTNYDLWMDWDYKCKELEAKIETERHKAEFSVMHINEWWLCTDRLANKLRENGEIVVTYGDMNFWGREEFCKIWLDDTLHKIARDIQILPGMAHDWSTHLNIEV